MNDSMIGFTAVALIFGTPIAAFYTFFRIRKLRTEERLAAIARGIAVPMQAELSESGRSRRAGILLTAGSLGFIGAFMLVGRVEPDAQIVAAFGLVPLAVGLGFFLDSALIRRDAARAS